MLSSTDKAIKYTLYFDEAIFNIDKRAPATNNCENLKRVTNSNTVGDNQCSL
jgi:hypothetical protein